MIHVPQWGLTGGIGSGKSTLSGMLADGGAWIVDSDSISRQATQPAGAAIAPIRAQFGDEYILADGSLDRPRMRARVFSDDMARIALEHIIHPLVAQLSEAHAQAGIRAGARWVVFDIPLLAESNRWSHRLDGVMVVDCPTDTQIDRVRRRSGLEEATVQAIIASQATREHRRQVADIIVHNGPETSLPQLQQCALSILRRFGL